jgi:hypothetical protein
MLYLLQFTIVTAAITDSLKEKEWFPHAQELQVIFEVIAIIVAILIATIPFLRKWAGKKIQKLARLFIYIWKIAPHPLSPIKAYRNQHEIYTRKDHPFRIKLDHCRKNDGTLDHECCSVSFENEIQPPQAIDIVNLWFRQGAKQVLGFSDPYRNLPYRIPPGSEKMDFKLSASIHGELHALFRLSSGNDTPALNTLIYP